MTMKRWSSGFYYDEKYDEYRVSIDIDFDNQDQCAEFGLKAMKSDALREAIEALAKEASNDSDSGVAVGQVAPERLGDDAAAQQRYGALEAKRQTVPESGCHTVTVNNARWYGEARVYRMPGEQYFDCAVDFYDIEDGETEARIDFRVGNGCDVADIAQAIANAVHLEIDPDLELDVDDMAAQLQEWHHTFV